MASVVEEPNYTFCLIFVNLTVKSQMWPGATLLVSSAVDDTLHFSSVCQFPKHLSSLAYFIPPTSLVVRISTFKNHTDEETETQNYRGTVMS